MGNSPFIAVLETADVLPGTLPESWATAPALSQLSTLRLEGCSFSGSVPASWLDRTLPLGAGLNRLVLRQNELTGTLPAAWGLRPNASVDAIYSLCAPLGRIT